MHLRNLSSLFAIAALLAAAPAAAVAQPAPADTIEVNYAYSSAGGVDHGARLGDVSVQRYGLEVASGTPLSDTTRLTYGVRLSEFALDADAAVPLPDRLRSLALAIGASHVLSPQWSAFLALQPGVYSDDTGFARDAFTVPAVLVFNYRARPGLAWSFGARYDAFSRYELLPVGGVRWDFTPGWTLNVGFPATGVFWQAASGLTLGAEASFQGGNFRLTRQPGEVSAAVYPGLKDSLLDYREIRLGLSASYRLAESVSVKASAGLVADRRFDYHERDLRLDGGTAGYLALSLDARF